MLLAFSNAVAQTQDINFGTNGVLEVQGKYYQGCKIYDNHIICTHAYDIPPYDDVTSSGYSMNGNIDFDFGDMGFCSPSFAFENSVNDINSNYIWFAGINPTGNFPNYDYKLLTVFYDYTGQLVNTLGNNGVVETDVIGRWQVERALSNNDGSKLYVTLSDYYTFDDVADSLCIVSFNQNGTLNNSWGNNGIAYYNLQYLSNNFDSFRPKGFCLGNQDIYIIGTVYSDNGNNFKEIALKINNDGSIDNSFGVKDLTQILALTNSAIVNDALIDGNYIYFLSGERKIHKLNISDFSVDSSFGTNGKITLSVPNGLANNLRIVNNSLYVLGSVSVSNISNPLLSKYDLNGAIDNNFGNNGNYLFTTNEISDEYYFMDVISYDANSLLVLGENYLSDGPSSGHYQKVFGVKINLAIPSQLNENFESQVKIYPNPAFDLLNVETKGNYKLKLYNMQGQLIQTHISNNPTKFDISGLSQGLYMAVIENSAGISRTSFIKQ